MTVQQATTYLVERFPDAYVSVREETNTVFAAGQRGPVVMECKAYVKPYHWLHDGAWGLGATIEAAVADVTVALAMQGEVAQPAEPADAQPAEVAP